MDTAVSTAQDYDSNTAIQFRRRSNTMKNIQNAVKIIRKHTGCNR